MLQTNEINDGNFKKLDLSGLPSPCFVLDIIKIKKNLETLSYIKARSDAKILIALKAFSSLKLSDLFSDYLDGCCASGLYEAQFAKKYYKGDLSCYSPAYKKDEVSKLVKICSHLIFNSSNQLNRYSKLVKNNNVNVGLRINPEISEVDNIKYNPASAKSRLGIPISKLTENNIESINGIHIHNLCEQDFPPLLRTWNNVSKRIKEFSSKLDWINLGGGHHLTRSDYQIPNLINFLKKISHETNCQIYMEPGEAVVFNAGVLVSEIIDIFNIDNTNEYNAILDVSATCHMPDVLEAPYKPFILNNGTKKNFKVNFGGTTCLACDNIGTYYFNEKPKIGDRIAFLDQAHYTTVKTNHFNGLPLPSIALWDSELNTIEIIKEFSYEDFETRLG